MNTSENPQNHEEKNKDYPDNKFYEALGWMHGECCAILDRGGDPRNSDVPEMVSRCTQDLTRDAESNDCSEVDMPVVEDHDSKVSQFRKELEILLNHHSMENGCDTPDFILAEYLTNCLTNFDSAVERREKWYGRSEDPSSFKL